ncbi:hypothetical protein FRC17_001111 [Serendipita sp. 399]|nr:hypothetical protein FRC17_001111 [Serendipita sp. 399]
MEIATTEFVSPTFFQDQNAASESLVHGYVSSDRLAEFITKYIKEVLQPVLPELNYEAPQRSESPPPRGTERPQQAQSQPRLPEQVNDPPSLHRPFNLPERQDNPLEIGRSDLDPIPNPFTGKSPIQPLNPGGGMYVGPGHPIFGGQQPPARPGGAPRGPWGGDGYLPPLGAPSGARFDPIVPFGAGGVGGIPGRGGAPRGGPFTGEPDNDEFLPPRFGGGHGGGPLHDVENTHPIEYQMNQPSHSSLPTPRIRLTLDTNIVRFNSGMESLERRIERPNPSTQQCERISNGKYVTIRPLRWKSRTLLTEDYSLRGGRLSPKRKATLPVILMADRVGTSSLEEKLKTANKGHTPQDPPDGAVTATQMRPLTPSNSVVFVLSPTAQISFSPSCAMDEIDEEELGSPTEHWYQIIFDDYLEDSPASSGRSPAEGRAITERTWIDSVKRRCTIQEESMFEVGVAEAQHTSLPKS